MSDYKIPPPSERLPVEPELEPEPEREPSGSRVRPIWIIALLAALGLAIAFLVLVQSDIRPSQFLNGGALDVQDRSRIAFIDSEGQLGTISPDGSGLRMLTDIDDERTYRFPTWAPNNPTVAAIGRDPDGGGLYLIDDRPDAALFELYAHREEGPVYHYWSPDGDTLSFIAPRVEGIALHVVPADGQSESRVVATGRTSFFWHWMPDSSAVFIHTGFTGDPNAQTKLAFVPVEGLIDETQVDRAGFFQNPAVAYDGQYYAFGSVDPLGVRWLTVHLTENGFTQWLQPHQGVVAMGWSPTDLELAYISPPDNRPTFYGSMKLLDLAEEELRELVDRTVLAFFWAPDGKTIAFLTLENFEPGDEQNLVELGLGVVDSTDGVERKLLTFQPSDVFVDRLMPFFDNYAQSHNIWSPDGHAIVLPMIDENGQNQIVVVPIDGTESVALTEGVAAAWSRD